MEKCNLCPRDCRVDRSASQLGYCNATYRMKISRAALHYWEEPSVSGVKGSGAVFFTGCNLRCVYCQNYQISRNSRDNQGREVSKEELIDIFYKLKDQGAENINLVTPTHFVYEIADTLEAAKRLGFDLPIVYNTGSYEKIETLRRLEGLVDVYLPDYKYVTNSLANKLSNATDYPEVALKAIEEMLRQTGSPEFDRGMIKKGVIVRHLCLPGHVKESKAVIKKLYDSFGDNIYISIMSQYTPIESQLKNYPELNRKLTKREYNRVVDYAIALGIENAYIQEGNVAKESFIPEWDIS